MSKGGIVNVDYRLQNPPEVEWDTVNVLLRRLSDVKLAFRFDEFKVRFKLDDANTKTVSVALSGDGEVDCKRQVYFPYADQLTMTIELEIFGTIYGTCNISLWHATYTMVQNVAERELPLVDNRGRPIAKIFLAMKFMKEMALQELDEEEFVVDVEAVCYKFQDDNAARSQIRPALRKVILDIDKKLAERECIREEHAHDDIEDAAKADELDLLLFSNEEELMELVTMGDKIARSKQVRYVVRLDPPGPEPKTKLLPYYPPKPDWSCDPFCDWSKQPTSKDRKEEYELIRQERIRRFGSVKAIKRSDRKST